MFPCCPKPLGDPENLLSLVNFLDFFKFQVITSFPGGSEDAAHLLIKQTKYRHSLVRQSKISMNKNSLHQSVHHTNTNGTDSRTEIKTILKILDT